MRLTIYRCLTVALAISFAPFVQGLSAQESVEEAMDGLLTRLYATQSLSALYAIDDARALKLITPEERHAFATKHWYFDVDVPVVVSIMRNIEQRHVPFWLEEAGFAKTALTVENMEGWVYEVWQKESAAGRVELGINGFDNFRPHYFVCVGPQEPGVKVTLSNFHPANQTVLSMQKGSMTYHDWTELVLTKVPKELTGQQLLPTIRGRGSEAALVGSFRRTPYPSSIQAGPIFLTWSQDPRHTQTVQWRTSTSVQDGVVRYRIKGSGTDFAQVDATRNTMKDRMLANDRYCHWFSAVVPDLAPGTNYEYQVGSPALNVWSATGEFQTAPDGDQPFSFFYCSDTHSSKYWSRLLNANFQRHPDTNFWVISGDLVGTGMEREDWDLFLKYGEGMFRTRPVMPAIGNHDAQLGLGAGMYLDIFGLPENGPAGITPESAYTFNYSNAQFFVLDVMSESEPQRIWLEQELAKSTAVWKIAIFHFPLYSNEEAYPRLEKGWATLFDTYHVDLVLTGHVHTHMRTYPMRAGKRVGSASEGTVYITSVSIPSRPAGKRKPRFAEVWVGGGSLCNRIEVDGKNLTFNALGYDGVSKDSFTLTK
ncbi:MAG: metallophosphoesterase family protein [Candidatus Hydrogenedentes bacterium]|nr:metallophosphoesterase family protein [Candidatus Hydrogenedentota bacterium]